MLPHAVRRDGVIGRQIFGALAGRGDGEARRARPVDHFGDQRRLIAIGHGIDHACRARLAGEQRAGERIGFDIDHDDVFFRIDRLDRMRNAGRRIACRFDHHFDALVIDGVAPALGETRARDAGLIPADVAARRLGALGIEIGDHRDFDAGDRRHLRQKHRAEFSGADQPDADRLAGSNASGE